MKKRKIYCENCKYFHNDNWLAECYNKNNFIKVDNAIYENNGYRPYCEDINCNNNCKYFEPKLFYKFKKFFKGE